LGVNWVEDDLNRFFHFTEYGTINGMQTQPAPEFFDYPYKLHSEKGEIIVEMVDGTLEKWDYQINGDVLHIVWPDGSQATFYRDGIKPR